ncbi:COG4705 family protein [Pseudoxanthomonas winnipegensis]|uniref:Membrane-anchored protein n=1 Tax=Pseudoxanthomonas winnipegensis TaxID=2480810 RepID=A0A4Q8L8S5_9GAMM|nr:hypothetical protein [Pseudoxanthomonas winnipegensis]RZZ81311.1 hypothetical protein EA662_18370 [Pseudoxanthomonas winnipegensis]TAA24225.1 hypothetical protein EA661_19290 [Pseudoxanthomonas winnipegensis]TAA36861.1 hypothetical protein EAT51_18900 [Pseudoxanthomonas winnipegensis]TBV74859.1 hypothetical protein EYC46_11385 [Pseudoxanthomonas winnipegensis]
MSEHGTPPAVANKVAAVTLGFWILKILATTLGETGGDWLTMTLGLGYGPGALLLLGLFALTLWAQLRARGFHRGLYWVVILSTSTAGTAMSDFLDRTLGLGYLRGALLLVALLAGVLAAWYRSEGHLSVQRIASRRAEGFYWMAILVSNTLGTALGDFLADSSGLGFAASAGLIAAVIAATALAYRFTPVSRVLLFWIAFVMTRPFGATFGDLLTKPVAHGGLELGTGGASLVLAVLLVAGLLVQGWGGRTLSAPNARSRRGRAGGTGPAGSAR